jgi:hypothetical protein
MFSAAEAAFGHSARSALVLLSGFQTRASINMARRGSHRGSCRVFYLAGLPATEPDGWSKAIYQRKRVEGELPTQALGRRPVGVI